MSNLKMCILCGCSFEPETTDQVTCKNCYSKTIKNVDKYRVAYLGQWIVVDNEYFQVTEEKLENRKTPIYHIISKRSNLEIGQIKWYGAWRKYCFFPDEYTVWDRKCLKELIDFLDEINKRKRGEKNEA